MKRWTFLFLALFAMSVAPGHAQAPDAPAKMSVAEWEAAWTNVLQSRVDEKGRVDFNGLKADHTALDKIVAFIAANDPKATPDRFPTKEARIAYDINAYNALAMKGIIDKGIPEDFGMLGRFNFFYLQKFVIGGRETSLYDFENDVIRPMGEPRVHFALNCMVRGCPRLPRTAFTAAKLEAQLAAAARLFVSERRNIDPDPARKAVHLSEIFDFYTDDFLKQAPSLISYVNRYRAEKLPESYTVEFIDYDWTVNIQP